MSNMSNVLYLFFGHVLSGRTSLTKPEIALFSCVNRGIYIAPLLLLLLQLSCSKSNVDPSQSNYFKATVDGKEIVFDNFVEAQMNIPKEVSLVNPYVFLIEASKVTGDVSLMYFFVESQSPIKAMTYDNSIRPHDVWFMGAGGTPPNDQRIPTGSKVTITSLTDTYAEGTFYGEVYSRGDASNKKILITDGKFRVHYKASQ